VRYIKTLAKLFYRFYSSASFLTISGRFYYLFIGLESSSYGQDRAVAHGDLSVRL
jgi:hypothetical protein